MKNFFIISCCILFFISCSRKTVPSKPNYALNNGKENTEVPTDSSYESMPPVDSTKMVSANSVSIVADAYGRLLTPQQSLPQDAGIEYNSLQLSKGFTPQQRANMQARYHAIPPRVLYVPQELSSSSLKGSYYIFKKKFWYWKKSDGLYYLDQKYYM
ncbi:MAG: hypothetical protein ABJA35_07040 [Parafilimonas sp.]